MSGGSVSTVVTDSSPEPQPELAVSAHPEEEESQLEDRNFEKDETFEPKSNLSPTRQSEQHLWHREKLPRGSPQEISAPA